MLPLAQRHQDTHHRHQRATAQVRDLHRGRNGLAVRLAGQPEDPVQAEVVEIVPGSVAPGAVLPVAGDRAVDEPRVLRAQALPAHAQPIQHARPERLEQHVGVARQPQQDLAAPVALEVDADRALAAVE